MSKKSLHILFSVVFVDIMMKKVVVSIVLVLSLNGCATYHPYFPAPDEQVNPHDQNPVPDDGAASVLRDIIRNK